MQEKFILRKKEVEKAAVADAVEPTDERTLRLVENKPSIEFDPEKTNAQEGLKVTKKDGKAVVEVGKELYNDLYKDPERKDQLSFSQGSYSKGVGRSRRKK